jgi:hypothetical protein
VAVHLRRGDIMLNDRAVVSEDELLFAMEAMRKAIVDAGENHGQAIVFHVFTQVLSSPTRIDCSDQIHTEPWGDDTPIAVRAGRERLIQAQRSQRHQASYRTPPCQGRWPLRAPTRGTTLTLGPCALHQRCARCAATEAPYV